MTLPANETPVAPAPAPPSAASGRSSGPLRLLFGVVLIVLLAAAGYGAWEWWERQTGLATRIDEQARVVAALERTLGELRARQEEQATVQADLARLANRNGTEIAALLARLEDQTQLMSRISADLSGGRERFQLRAVEHLLLLAHDRLRLQRDARAALAAVEAADERLAALSDPQLFAVREALARERAALLAVPVPDLASATLSLSSLIERIPVLPLASHAPAQFQAPEQRKIAMDDPLAAGWSRLWQSVQTAVRSLFTLRRDDNARAMRVLPPEAEASTYHLLRLRLESARVALVSGNTVALREALGSARAWLESEFKADDPGVQAALGEIERLQKLELSPPLPEFGASLVALRAQLDARR